MNTNNLLILLIAIGVIVAAGYFSMTNYRNNGMMSEEHHEDEMVKDYEIYPGDVAEKIRGSEDIILLDVRTLEEYEEVHLENALLLPVQELSVKSLADIGLGESAKDKEIIIYCRSGARSKTAYDIMKSLGYTNIKSVAGGMIHWEEDENPFTEMGAYMGSHMMNNRSGESSLMGPKISFDRKLHNFGEVPQFGGVVETTFTVKNDGKEPLIIGELSTSCGCTTAKISSTEIPAGESTNLVITFDPDLHEEPKDVFKRTVFVPSNDTSVPEAELSIQVDVIEGQ